jgi:hypothetical protein
VAPDRATTPGSRCRHDWTTIGRELTGITYQRVTPGSPQENWAHERLHKTLKERTARPPVANLNLQQRVFTRSRETYNELRPHQALDDETPASRLTPSPRPYPESIAPPRVPWPLRGSAGQQGRNLPAPLRPTLS